MPNPDLDTVIEDSITDSEMPPEDTSTEVSPESTPEPEASPEPSNEAPDPSTETSEVASPGAKADPLGIPGQSASGRENRIPYSRVQKITAKAVSDAVTAKTKELETLYTPKIQEYEARLRDNDARFEKVDQFEQIMVKEPRRFLEMLASLPQYQEIFQALQGAQGAQPTTPADPYGDMPQPDDKLPDGSMVYSMEGLKALMAWNTKQTEDRVTKQITSRYAPIEQEWQSHQKIQQVLPQVKAQIADAQTWPLFNENETDIVKALQANPNLSLERAYQQVVYPKLLSDRNKMREDLLKEVKQAPRSTSAPATGSKSTVATTSTGPRSLEDVINESIKGIR